MTLPHEQTGPQTSWAVPAVHRRPALSSGQRSGPHAVLPTFLTYPLSALWTPAQHRNKVLMGPQDPEGEATFPPELPPEGAPPVWIPKQASGSSFCLGSAQLPGNDLWGG